MGFAAPWALVALATIALPIIAHLLRRRDVPVRALPTIALLRKAEVSSRKRVKIVDLALLAARIGLVALAALALAMPFLLSSLAWGDGRVTSIALVVDDSMSMSRANGGQTTLEHAIERAGEILDSLPAGSEASLVMAGEPPRVLVPRTDELERVRAGLEAASTSSARGTSMGEALTLARRQLSSARHPARRVIVLSDFARHADIADILEAQPEDLPFDFERVGPSDDAPNLTISEVTVSTEPSVLDELAITVEVRAFGAPNVTRVPVSVRHAGQEIARTEVTLEEGGGRSIVHVPMPTGSDPSAEAVIITNTLDALPLDDRHGLLLRPAASPRVLLVDGEPRPLGRRRLGGGGEEVRFVSQALSLAPRDMGAFVSRTVDADTFLTTSPGDADVVVLANVALGARPSMRARIEEHLARGGGLLIAAGSNIEPGTFSMPSLPARIVSVTGGENIGLERGESSSLLPPGPTGLSAVRAQRRLVLEPDPSAEIALTWSDGGAALVLSEDHRIAMLGTALDDEWSDLPYRPGFLPLIVRVLRTLAPRGAMPDAPCSPGHVPALSVPRDTTGLVIIGPSGQVIERSGAELERPVDLPDAVMPGAWRVQMARADEPLTEAPRSAFVIAAPLSESDLSLGEVPEAVGDHGDEPEGARVVQRPVAAWFFLAMGMFAILEGALRFRRR